MAAESEPCPLPFLMGVACPVALMLRVFWVGCLSAIVGVGWRESNEMVSSTSASVYCRVRDTMSSTEL